MSIEIARNLITLYNSGKLKTPSEFESEKLSSLVNEELSRLKQDLTETFKNDLLKPLEEELAKANERANLAEIEVSEVKERSAKELEEAMSKKENQILEVAEDGVEETLDFKDIEVSVGHVFSPIEAGALCDVDMNELADFNLPDIDVDVNAIVIEDIQDEEGILCERVNSFEDKLKISVLPFEITGMHQTTNSINNHVILEVNGHKCSSSVTRIINEESFNNFVETIRQHLEHGKPFKCILNNIIIYGGEQYPSLRLNLYELSWIKKYFSNYTFMVKKSGEDSILIVR